MYTKNINIFKNNIEKERFKNKKNELVEIASREISKQMNNFIGPLTEDKLKQAKRNIKTVKELEALEKLSNSFSTQNSVIDVLNTKDRITILGRKIKDKEKQEDELLTKAINLLNDNNIFNKMSTQLIDSDNVMHFDNFDYTDFNGINMTSSLKGLNDTYEKVQKMIKNQNGFIHTIDTETLGSTVTTGVWRPSQVTEFAKITRNLSTGEDIKTNILLTDPQKYREEWKRIQQALELGKDGVEKIKNDQSLQVSIERFALYGSDKTKISYNTEKGFSFVKSIADIKDIDNIYDLDLLEKGFKKLLDARTDVLNINGIQIKADVKEYIDSIVEIQKSLANGTGIVSGYNINKFDLKTINASIKNIIKEDKTGNVAKYIKQIHNINPMDIGIRNINNRVLDLQNYARAFTNIYGPKSLIGEEIFNKIFGQRVNRQEYIGEKFYPKLMTDTSHTAIADVQVAHAFVLEQALGLNTTLLEHMQIGINKSGKYAKIDENGKLINQKLNSNSLFFANKSSSFNDDRNVLSFVTDREGNIFFSSGQSIIKNSSNKGEVHFSNLFEAPSTGIKKGSIYSIEDIISMNIKDIEGLSTYLPEYSSGKLNVVKMKQYGAYGTSGISDEEYIYKVFDTIDEAIGFINSTFSHAGDFDDSGNFTLNKKINEKIKTLYRQENKRKKYFAPQNNIGPNWDKNWNQLTDLEKINEYVYNLALRNEHTKGFNYITGDKSIKRIAGLIDFINEIEKSKTFNLEMLSNEDNYYFLDYYYSKGKNHFIAKDGKKYTEKEFAKLDKIMKRTLGFAKNGDEGKLEYKLLPTTVFNAISAIQNINELKPYYENLLKAMFDIDSEKGYKKSILSNNVNSSIFNDLNEFIYSSIAVKIYGNNDKALRVASKVMPGSDTAYNLKNIYDFKISDKFYRKKPNKKINNFNVYNEVGDIFTINTAAPETVNVFLNNLFKKHMGDIPIENETQKFKYTKAAFANFIKEIDENYTDNKSLFKNKRFSKMVNDVLNGDFDLYESADILINTIKNIKKKNINAGIIRKLDDKSLYIGNNLAKELNDLSVEEIKEYLKNINKISIRRNTEKVKYRDIDLQRYADEITSKYLFDKDELKNISFKTEVDKKRAYRLYNEFEKRVNNTIYDILDAAELTGTNITFDKKTGEMILVNGKDTVKIKDIPKLMLDDNMLYIRTSSGTSLQYHESLRLDKNNKIVLDTNLGKDFGTSKNKLSKIARIRKNEGTFNLDMFLQSMSIISGDYKESALLNFSMKDYITGNGIVDISALDPIFSMMFGKESTKEGRAIWNRLVNENKINNPDIEKYLNTINKELKKGELSPTNYALILSDINTILEEFVDKMSPEANDILEVIRNLNTSGKDTNVADKLLQDNIRNIGNIFNQFSNVGRPTTIAQLNAKYFRSMQSFKPILKTNTIEGTKYIYENLLIGSSIIETKDIMQNIYKNLNIGLNKSIDIQTDFTHSVAYLGVLGLDNTFANEATRVINEFRFDDELNIDRNKQEELIKNVYAKLYNKFAGSTFEQSRIMDSRLIDTIYGSMPQDIQKLSTIKDIEGAIESMVKDTKRFNNISNKTLEKMGISTEATSNRIQDLFRVLGTIKRSDNGDIVYKKSVGTIVRIKEPILKTATYGDSTAPFSSKFNTGILNFTIRSKENIELTEDEIAKVIVGKLREKSKEEADKIINEITDNETALLRFLGEVFDGSYYGIKGAFEIINANNTELIKTGNSEKGMTNLPRVKAGELDNTLKDFMKDIGAGEHIGIDALSPEAFAAYIEDYSVKNPGNMQQLVEKYGKLLNIEHTKEALIEKIAKIRNIEQYEYSRMLFGKNGIFKGEVSAVFNDNVLGHGNYDISITGTLSKAAELYGKHLNKNGTIEEQYKTGLEGIVDLINNKKEFQFLINNKFSNSNNKRILTERARKLSVEGTTILFGDKAMSDIDVYDIVNIEKFNKLIEHIDEQIKNDKDMSPNQRLVFENVYTLNKNGEWEYKDKIIGNLRIHKDKTTGKRYVDGINANVVTKTINDSEVQSFVSADYLHALTLINKKRAELESLEISGDKKAANILKDEIKVLENYALSQDEYSNRMKVDDQMRNILSGKKINEVTEANLNKRLADKGLSQEFLSASKDFLIYDSNSISIKKEFLTDNVYDSWIEDIRGLMTYDPTKEHKLTKDMLKYDKYKKFTNLYDLVNNELGMELGVNSAQKIYNIQGAIRAFSFNDKHLESHRTELLNNYGYTEMHINDFARTFGTEDFNVNSMLNNGYIINIKGRGFNEEIAIPGLESLSGNKEVSKEWTSAFNTLSENWNKYINYIGDTENVDNKDVEKLKTNIVDSIMTIKQKINENIAKNKDFGNLAKIEASVPYSRTKLLSLSDPIENRALIGDMIPIDPYEDLIRRNSFKSKAKINGRTLNDWEKGGLNSGVFFDYGTASIEDFERFGFFDKSYMDMLGIKNKEEMINYLETNGTMMLVNRYPDIREESVQNVRIFLDRNASSGSTSLAKHTLLKFNGDSDGDSISKMLLQRYGVDYAAFNKIREDAINDAKIAAGNIPNYEPSSQQIRTRTIQKLKERTEQRSKNKEGTIALTIADATNLYNDMIKYEAQVTLQTLDNIDVVAEQVLPTMFKDEAKNYKLSGGDYYNITELKNIGAQVEGGKSILGKIRVSNLENSPGSLDEKGSKFYFENTKQINSYMERIATNKENLMKNYNIDLEKFDYIKDLTSSSSDINLYKYGQDQHNVLDEILSIIETDTGKNGKNLLGINGVEAREAVVDRIRSDIYNQNSISKANKGVIGNINASLYAIRQAYRDTYNPKSLNDNFRDNVVQLLGYELEEHVISSKKEVFKPGDERLSKLTNIIYDSKGNNRPLENVTTELRDWMTSYMKDSKINEIYTTTFKNNEGGHIISNNIFNDEIASLIQEKGITEKEAINLNKAHHIAKTFVESIHTLSNDPVGRNSMEMYSIFGRRSGTVEKLINNVDMENVSNKSFNATASFLAFGKVPEIQKNIPNSNINKNVNSNINKNTIYDTIKILSNSSKDILNNISGSGLAMGVLGLAAGLSVGAYASGNPLNDPKNDNIKNKPEKIQNISIPDFFDQNSGYATINPQQKGYIINIKADTRRGQRYAKKAMKQAVTASTGGAVNINMNFKSNNSGGYSDKDIEDLLNNYI